MTSVSWAIGLDSHSGAEAMLCTGGGQRDSASLLNETRVGHTNRMTKEQWEKINEMQF